MAIRVPRRSGLIAAGAVAGALFLYWGYSVVLLGRMVDSWNRNLAAAGIRFQAQSTRAAGFPFDSRLEFAPAVLVDTRDGMRLRWMAERVSLRLRPWPPHLLLVETAGETRIERSNTPDAPGIVLRASHTKTRLRFAADLRLESGRISIDDARLSPLPRQADETPAELMSIAAAALDLARDWSTAQRTAPAGGDAAALSVQLALAKLRLPGAAAVPLGKEVDRVLLTGVLDPLPTALAPGALDAWQRSGGQFRVDRLALDWGAVHLDARGALGLDSELRPSGGLDSEIDGLEAAVDMLAATGAIKLNLGTTAKIVLGMLARPKEEGGVRVVPVKIVAQQGHLYLGPMPIARLDPIATRERP